MAERDVGSDGDDIARTAELGAGTEVPYRTGIDKKPAGIGAGGRQRPQSRPVFDHGQFTARRAVADSAHQIVS